MDTTKQPETTNQALLIIRRLAADKRTTQQQMRNEFATDPDIRRAMEELNRRAVDHQPTHG